LSFFRNNILQEQEAGAIPFFLEFKILFLKNGCGGDSKQEHKPISTSMHGDKHGLVL
jgi:hypothetical protein